MMNEFELDEVVYRNGKMAPMTQFQVTRRLLPILSQVKTLTAAFASKDEKLQEEAFGAAAKALAALTDADTEFVINACMDLVERQNDKGSWNKIWNPHVMRPQFDDIDMPVMLQLVTSVLQSEFTKFFPSGGRTSPDQQSK